MFKYFLIFYLLSISASFADEAEDKAEFKRLYAEFNELYANSEDIDPIIDAAERVYRLPLFAHGLQ